MKINVIAIGGIKEKYLKEAIKEYGKRISRYAKLNIIEIKEEKLGDNSSQKDIEEALEREGQKIFTKCGERDYTIVLAIEGKQIESEKLARKIGDLTLQGYSTINFIIGSSHGLSSEVKTRANFSLSFSKMTLPHQLMRVVLLEQIYRAFKIQANEPYHK